MGADFTIAVNVLDYTSNRTQKASTENIGDVKQPNIFSILIRMISIMGYQAAISGIKEADITITPNVGHIRPSNFHQARECILQGHRAARRALPKIKRLLEV
jgi:predicted acylesterase/phospholipase RssA